MKIQNNILYYVKFHHEKENKEYNWDGFIIRGENAYIVSSVDLVHKVVPNDKPIVLDATERTKISEGYEYSCISVPTSMTFKEVEEHCEIRRANAKEDISYFGIKNRTRDNYKLFKNSLHAIGCKISLPQWGKR